jgi:hypothetical protein
MFQRGWQGLRPEHVHVREMTPLSPIFEERGRGADERTVPGFTSFRFCVAASGLSDRL